MKICKTCGNKFKHHQVIDGKKRNLQNRSECLNCLPFGISKYASSNISPEERKKKYLSRKAKNTRDFYHRQKLVISKMAGDRKLAVIKLIGGCQICGYSKSHNLTFHHVLKHDKECQLDKRRFQFSWKTVKKELLKCILVCHHCHGDIHHDGLDDKQHHKKLIDLITPLNDWPKQICASSSVGE